MSDVRLTVGYSTTADRYANIELPVQDHGVEVLIIVQGSMTEIQPVVREDVRTIPCGSIGVAKSRNVAITEARGEFLLFGDEKKYKKLLCLKLLN